MATLQQSKGKKKYTKRLAAAAGSLAGVALAPVAADAGVVVVTGQPVSLSLNAAPGSSVTWDIDGDGNSDFRIWAAGGSFKGTYSFSGTFSTYYGGSLFLKTYLKGDLKFRSLFIASDASQNNYGVRGNGRGLVAPFRTDDVLALRQSQQVGPSNYFGRQNGTYFDASNGYYRWRNAMFRTAGTLKTYFYIKGAYGTFKTSFSFSGTNSGIGYDFFYGFAPGENYVGFRFVDSGGNLHYGYAVFVFDFVNGMLTIDRWAYESTPDTAIHVSPIANRVVPEPSSLALLASGAAGLLAYRARRKAAPKAQTEAPADSAA